MSLLEEIEKFKEEFSKILANGPEWALAQIKASNIRGRGGAGFPMSFKLKFWGVRGSIACPSADHIQFGGNTSCLEVNAGGHQIILDAGTGIRNLGHWSIRKGVNTATILELLGDRLGFLVGW